MRGIGWFLTAGSTLATAVAVASPQVAEAQTVQPAPAPTAANPTVPATASPQDEGAVAGDIVVTGSRIQGNGYSQPTPVTTSTAQALQNAAPSTVADALVQLPQFAASTSRGTCCAAGTGGAFLNLRGLGSDRNLIMLDGNRVVPTNGSVVDVNLLPEMLLQRVDIVTGGASAAYGSDAVSGVVNYVTDRKFTGVKLVAQAGISKYGDDASRKFGLAVGKDFAGGRGHIMASIEHFETDGISSVQDRPISRNSAYLTGFSTPDFPFQSVVGVRQNTASVGGIIVDPAGGGLPTASADAPLAGLRFVSGGGLTPYNFGEPLLGFASVSRGGDGFSYDGNTPLGSLNTSKIFARVDYQLTDNVTAHVRVAGAKTRSVVSLYGVDTTATTLFTIYRDNAFLSPQVKSLMDSQGVSSFSLSRYLQELGGVKNDNSLRFIDVNAGLDGKLFGNWTWNADYLHGESRFVQRVANNPILGDLYASADAVVNPANGNIVCRVTLTNPGTFPGCAPINLFGEGSISEQAKAFVAGTSRAVTVNKQDVFTASAQGTLLELPAGPLAVVVGGEYRRRSVRATSNAIALSQINATGVRGVPTAVCPTPQTCQYGGYYTGNFGEASANETIKEAFAEVNVPIITHAPLIRSLELNAAYRYTDYQHSGGASTWKFGLDYRPFEDLRIRATRSRDIRAPNLGDLFSGAQTGFAAGISDPQTGNSNLYITTITEGNRALKPEIGNTYTIGGVYSPSFLPGLRGSIDYYNINLTGALSLVDAQSLVNNCAAGDTVSCGLVTRDASGNISSISIQRINLASRKTSGIDFDLSYTRHALGGNVMLRAIASRLISFTDVSGGVTTDRAGFQDGSSARPKWRGNLNVNYQAENWSLFVQERYIGPIEQFQFLGNVFANPKIKAVAYTDLTLTILAGQDKRFELYGTINNVFDKQPPLVANFFGAGLGIPTLNDVYDIDGRYMTVGVRVHF